MHKRTSLVKLTDDQRTQLIALTQREGLRHYKRIRAHVLLEANAQASDQSIAKPLNIHRRTVQAIRQRFVEGGLEVTLTERHRPSRRADRLATGLERDLERRQAASLVALACSAPPEGERWSVPLLTDRLIERGVLKSISPTAVQRTPKDSTPPHGGSAWPPHEGRSGMPVRSEDARATRPRIFELTGLTVEEFERLIPAFEVAFLLRMEHWTSGGTRRTGRRYMEPANASLPTPEDRLLFILMYLNQMPTQAAHGMAFRMSQSQVSRWLRALLPALRTGLLAQGTALTRGLATVQQRLPASC
jgi:hypothetical protein